MSDHHHSQAVPVGALVAAAILIVATIGLAATSRAARLAEASSNAPAIESLDVRFEDRTDGSIVVFDAASGRALETVPPASNGFLRGVLRGMFRSRKLESIDRGEKFVLARQANGRLTLEDPKDGRRIDLDSFGPTNGLAFSTILEAGKKAQ